MSVFESSPATPPVLRAELPLLDEAQLAAAAFLARYSGRTLESYRADLRKFAQWADDVIEPLQIIGKGNMPAGVPLVPRTARTLDLAIGERTEGPILLRHDGRRLDARTAYRWVRSVGSKAGLERVHPHMLRAAFIMAALGAGVPLRDVQIAATVRSAQRDREHFATAQPAAKPGHPGRSGPGIVVTPDAWQAITSGHIRR